MNRIFEPQELFTVPDGTLLSPFINSKDSMSNLPFDLVDGFSIAYGVIKSRMSSKIVVHQYVDQVTYVLSGKLKMKIKGVTETESYTINIKQGQAVISAGGEFLQLINKTFDDCQVLYIVSPAYIFLKENDVVIYDDAISLDHSWEELDKLNWLPKELTDERYSLEARKKAYKTLKNRK